MKNILFLIPYENIYPPQNGGMLRCFHFLNQCAKYFTITAITFQRPESLMEARNRYPSLDAVHFVSNPNLLSFPQADDIWRKLQNALKYRIYQRSLKGPADGNFLRYHQALLFCLKEKKFNIIILENLSGLKAVNLIRRWQPEAKLVYDAHNFDTHLAELDWKKGLNTYANYVNVKNIESSLGKLIDLILTCSNEDASYFKLANKEPVATEVIPNGVEIGVRCDQTAIREGGNTLFFCGTLDYFPNEEGLLWFIEQCWPLIREKNQDTRLLIAGSGIPSQRLNESMRQPGIIVQGRVTEISQSYKEAAVCIVPLLSGSGTRLKVLEAMGMGVPIVSTSKGSEGIAYTPGAEIMVADEAGHFSALVLDLLNNREKRISQANRARQLAEREYDWKVIGRKLIQCLTDLA